MNGKLKMPAINRKYIYQMYISACMHDINKIPTGAAMFSGSSHTIGQVKSLSESGVRVSRDSNMAFLNQK